MRRNSVKTGFRPDDFVSFFTWCTGCTLRRYWRVKMSLLSWLEVLISSKSGVRLFCLRTVQVSLRQKCLRISTAIWTVLYHLVDVNVKGVIHQFCQFLFISSSSSNIFSTFIWKAEWSLCSNKCTPVFQAALLSEGRYFSCYKRLKLTQKCF